VVSILPIPHPETLPDGHGYTPLRNIVEHALLLKKFFTKETKDPKWQSMASCTKFKRFMTGVPSSKHSPIIRQLAVGLIVWTDGWDTSTGCKSNRSPMHTGTVTLVLPLRRRNGRFTPSHAIVQLLFAINSLFLKSNRKKSKFKSPLLMTADISNVNGIPLPPLAKAHQVSSALFGVMSLVLLAIPDKTLTKRLASKWGGAAGFGLASYLSYILQQQRGICIL
jgi:hypothetical protein